MRNGTFVISLDFELAWGSIYKFNKLEKKRFHETREVILEILELFSEYNVHATWGVVGALKCRNKTELLALLNGKIEYPSLDLNINEFIKNNLGKDEQTDSMFFAPDLINIVRGTKGQYIGSHSFTHFLCYENNKELFNGDVISFQKIEPDCKSFIFPRNQVVSWAIDILKKQGILYYRGNQNNSSNNILYKGRHSRFINLFVRGVRLIDYYLPITGYYCYFHKEIPQANGTFNVRASSYFRPYTKTLAIFESLKLRRIIFSMRKAAIEGKVYHLWWHPWNFANNREVMLKQLKVILDEYMELNKKHGFKSMSIEEIANSVERKR